MDWECWPTRGSRPRPCGVAGGAFRSAFQDAQLRAAPAFAGGVSGAVRAASSDAEREFMEFAGMSLQDKMLYSALASLGISAEVRRHVAGREAGSAEEGRAAHGADDARRNRRPQVGQPVQALRARPRASRSPATRSRSMSAAGSRTWNSTSSAINQYVRLSRDAALQRSRQRASSTSSISPAADAGGHGRPWRMQHDARLRRIGAESQRARYVLRRSPRQARDAARSARVVAGPAMRSRRKMRQSSRAGSQATRYQRWLACATPCGSTMRELAWPRPS